MTTASSTSQSVFTDPRGSTRSSLGPHSAVVAFMNSTGSLGGSWPCSLAWPKKFMPTQTILLGRLTTGPSALAGGDRGAGALVLRQPGAQAVQAVGGEERLVVVLPEGADVDGGAVGKKDAGPFLARGAEAKELHGRFPITGGRSRDGDGSGLFAAFHQAQQPGRG